MRKLTFLFIFMIFSFNLLFAKNNAQKLMEQFSQMGKTLLDGSQNPAKEFKELELRKNSRKKKDRLTKKEYTKFVELRKVFNQEKETYEAIKELYKKTIFSFSKFSKINKSLNQFQIYHEYNDAIKEEHDKMKKFSAVLSYLWIIYLFLAYQLYFFLKLYGKRAYEKYKSKEGERKLNRARKLFDSKKYKNAIPLFRESLSNEKNLKYNQVIDLYIKLMKCYINTGNEIAAVGLGKKFMSIDAQNKDVNKLIADIYIKNNNKTEDAIRKYNFVLKHNISTVHQTKMIDLLAKDYAKRQIFTREATTIYKKFLKQNPNNLEIVKTLFEEYARRAKTDADAIMIYERMAKIEPENMNVRVVLAKSYYKNNSFKKSIEQLKIVFENGHVDNKDLLQMYKSSCINDKIDLKEEFLYLLNLKPNNNKLLDVFSEYKNIARQQGLETNDMSVLASEELSENIDNHLDSFDSEMDDQVNIEDDGFKVCKKCSHLNPGKVSVCEDCSSPLE